MPTASQNSAALATSAGGAALRGGPRPPAGPVQVRAQLLEDVLPQVVEGSADTHPGVLAGAAEEGLDAEPERPDLRPGDQLGERAELPVAGHVPIRPALQLD